MADDPLPPDEDEETAVDLRPAWVDRTTTITVRTTVPDDHTQLDLLECKGGVTQEPLSWSGRLRAAPLKAAGAAISHTGLVREGNEDAFLVWPESNLAVVADGMGGRQGGEVASAIAVEAIRDVLVAHGAAQDTDHAREMLLLAVQSGHARINDLSGKQVELKGMGTTLVALWLIGEQALVVHVGDSRVYRLRDGELTQLTGDHSLAQELKNRGILDTQTYELFPNKHVLTQALGGKEDIHPDTTVLDTRAGDRFLLCTDGLSDFVEEHLVCAFLGTPSGPDVQARTLVEAALANGGRDNVTVAVVQVLEA